MRWLLAFSMMFAPVSAAPEAPGPAVVTPAPGATVPYDQDLTVSVRPVAEATGYLYGFFEHGAMVWENNRDEGHLDGTSYTIRRGSRGHQALRPADQQVTSWGVQIWVRAYVRGQEWTAATVVDVILTTQVPPSAPPPVAAGALYSADWSAGLNGWTGAGVWKTLRGQLLSDGTGLSESIAPWDPAGRADYTVEAEIRSHPGGGTFGLIVRRDTEGTGYVAVVEGDGNRLADNGGGRLTDGERFDPGDGWHRYRLRADGNVITFSVDGTTLLTWTDNKYLAAGRVGLWSRYHQVEVRGFRVLP